MNRYQHVKKWQNSDNNMAEDVCSLLQNRKDMAVSVARRILYRGYLGRRVFCLATYADELEGYREQEVQIALSHLIQYGMLIRYGKSIMYSYNHKDIDIRDFNPYASIPF